MKAYPMVAEKFQLRPTGHGLIFMLILIAMTAGSLNYNNNMAFLLSFLMGSIALVSLFRTYKNLTGLYILGVAVKPVFAGESAVFELQVHAEQPPKFAISFSFTRSESSRGNTVTDQGRRVSVMIKKTKRGILKPGALLVDTHYPLGLFCCRARIPLDAHCLVYPKPIAAPFDAAQNHISSEGEGQKVRPGIEDFQGLSPYQPGEPVERIYWKAFSKGQGLYLKYFAQPAGKAIVLDWHAISGGHTEQKLSFLCDAVLKAHRMNLTYGLNLPGKYIAPGSSDRHRQSCLKALALYGN